MRKFALMTTILTIGVCVYSYMGLLNFTDISFDASARMYLTEAGFRLPVFPSPSPSSLAPLYQTPSSPLSSMNPLSFPVAYSSTWWLS